VVRNPDRAAGLFAELAIHDSREGIKRALAAARDLLDMEIVFLSAAAAGEEERVADRRRGTFTVPVRFSDGRVYGSLCCSSRNRFRELTLRDERFVRVLARVIADQLEREEHEIERHRMTVETAGLRALLAAVDARDAYTAGHCRSVVDLSVKVACRLGLSPREVAEVEQVALLHDVGKVAVPDEVLQKPGALTDEEFEVVKAHPVTGARIVRSIAGLAHLAPAIRAGHERWDGRGYPDGLRGSRIPMIARITFVCDAYDAMTSHRPYRRALDPAEAVEELERHAGTQFCARCVAALLETLEEEGEIGARVGIGA
jgi:HD-GYP domain-containing protein (c-di-GMP phosphodiesterase class II)